MKTKAQKLIEELDPNTIRCFMCHGIIKNGDKYRVMPYKDYRGRHVYICPLAADCLRNLEERDERKRTNR